MKFANVRRTLFTVHMWVGLILGILLAALGLSGSLLVYDEKVANLISPSPHAITAGAPLPLTMMADIGTPHGRRKGHRRRPAPAHPAGSGRRRADRAHRRH